MKKCKIMIVDDEIIVRQAVRYMLEKNESYSILGEAQNGQEAVTMLANEVPDVLICDIAMPIIDGVELIKYVKLKYPSVFIVVLSGYDDFEYVKECFRQGVCEYLLKPKLNKDNLYETLERICISIGVKVDNQEDNIVQTIFANRENAEMVLRNEPYANQYVGCIGLNLSKIVGFDTVRIGAYKEAIYDKVSHIYNSETLDWYATKDNILLLGLVFTHKNDCRWRECVNMLAKELSHIMLGVKIIYSKLNDCAEEIIECVEGVYETAKLQFFIQNDTFVIGAIKPPIHCKLDLYKKYSAGERDVESNCAMIQEFLSDVTLLSGYKEDELKKQMEHIMYSIFSNTRFPSSRGEGDELDYMAMIDMISELYSLDDLKSYIEGLFLIIGDTMDSGSRDDKLLEQIMAYIRMNYQEQLTLQQVSVEFHISYSYLSTYFTHRLGFGFSEYLNKIRVEQAKLLLKETEDSISTICDRVGYLDQSYFSKVFKKFVGMSPSAYRRI